MNKKMKILIAYDGSQCADAALDDLQMTGLPSEAEATVISVAELWLPPPSSYEVVTATTADSPSSKEEEDLALTKQAEALMLARRAAQRIRLHFPKWEVSTETASGSPAWEVIKKADYWKPNLIIVGSHGRSALGRFWLGSLSQKVVTEARCSVRVARGRIQAGDSPVRIIIGIDGSPNAEAAVQVVATRTWPKDSEVRLVTSIGPFPHMTGPLIDAELSRFEELHRPLEAELRAAGLAVSTLVEVGDPKLILLKEAESWGASSIFVGASGLNRFERFLLGSVSTAVVTRAHCSVEVVRLEETT